MDEISLTPSFFVILSVLLQRGAVRCVELVVLLFCVVLFLFLALFNFFRVSLKDSLRGRVGCWIEYCNS
jgi:hypothetical protein